jgi:hypothetical protein
MVTYEDITDLFVKAAEEVGLSAHPETWLNSATLEREFNCTLHAGTCEEAEGHAACTVAMNWGPLDTVLSIDGAEGVCDFFHEPEESCPHLQTDEVPPLTLDLSYILPLKDMSLDDASLKQLQSVMRSLKLNAAEHSSRALETQPNVALMSNENGLMAEAITVQQRVELPLWDPEGPSGFRSSGDRRSGHTTVGRGQRYDFSDQEDPHPEDWLPHLLLEVAGDVARVIGALDTVHVSGRTGSATDDQAED